MSAPRTSLLVTLLTPPDIIERLAAVFEVHYILDGDERARFIADSGAAIDLVLTNGTIGLNAKAMEGLPNLRLISCFGAGFEGVDLAAADARGIPVSHGPGTGDAGVADHAFALILAVTRHIPRLDAAVRAGNWAEVRADLPLPSGKRLGIIGLGRIGAVIARRAEGFDMEIAYHNRRPRPDCAYPYFADPAALAERSTYLVAACPGGPGTKHLIGARVLAALGRDGYLINIARGSVVDTGALIAALKAGTIAGAGLDVFEGEPNISKNLFDLENLVLSPHIAGRAPETGAARLELFLKNVEAVLGGGAPLNPVPRD